MNMDVAPRRVLVIAAGGHAGIVLARALPAGGLLILMDADPIRGATTRQRFVDAGLADRASVIIGDPARMLYKIAGPFDVIVHEDDLAQNAPLRQTLGTLLRSGGRLVTKNVMGSDPVMAALEKIENLNPSLNAFITVLAAEALADNRPGGPLHDRPISIKDIIDVAGVPTTAASRVRAGYVARSDAPAVARLRQAGAAIVGKCNLHEFALGTTSDESAFGPVRNPHDTTRSPGGSSGGSAVAVATGMSWASIGTDTGGSIRIPAAACGIVGLKPSFGEIPTVGVVPLSVSLDHVGPLACSVTDAWTVYEVLKNIPQETKAPAPLSQVRLGTLGGYFLEKLDAEVRQRFDEAIQRLKAAGATIVDVSLPHMADVPATYLNVALPEAAAYHEKTLTSMPEAYSEGVRTRLEMGFNIPREDYVKAQGHRGILRAAVDAGLARCDALVLPTLPIPAPIIGATTVSVGGKDEPIRPLMLRLTQLFNLTGHPAISLPCGTTREGLPCGFQMVGRRDGTVDLLRVSLGCEAEVTPRERAPAGGHGL